MTKMPTVQVAAQARNSPPVETALTVNIKSVQVGMINNETNRTYAAEDAFELEMPTRTLSVNEANCWLAMIAEAEGVDRPIVFKSKMSKNTEALAFSEDWCIAVRESNPTQLLLLHEMAHLLCANKNHGTEFRTELIRLVRRYISLPHAATLQYFFIAKNLLQTYF
jgi:hypothetical protein